MIVKSNIPSFFDTKPYFRNATKVSGFALVVTLTLMSFIFLLLVSLTSFISVEVQVSTNNKASLMAKENAILGLNVALSQLQKVAGPDKRISARADVLADQNQYWTGIWHTDPSEPDYDASAWPAWLVSGNSNLSLNDPAASLSSGSIDVKEIVPQTANHPAILVNKVNITDLSKLNHMGTTGKYAYWVGDEGIKAKFNKIDPYSQSDNTVTDNRRLTVSQRNGIEIVVPTYPANGGTVNSSVTREHFQNLTGTQIDDYYHDFSSVSYSLLTNSVKGGLKKDLTAVFEFENDGDRALPPEFAQNTVFETTTPAIFGPRWEYLQDYYWIHNKIKSSGGVDPIPAYDSKDGRKGVLDTDGGNSQAIRPYNNIRASDSINAWVSNPITPIISEMAFVLSVIGGADGRPIIRLHPFVELTNPYNVPLEGAAYEFQIGNMKPNITFEFSSTSEPNAPRLEITKDLQRLIEYDIPKSSTRRRKNIPLFINVADSSIEPGRTVRFFAKDVYDYSNITSFNGGAVQLLPATDIDNWDSGYLEIRVSSAVNTQWPSVAAFSAYAYDTLTIEVSYPSGSTFGPTTYLNSRSPGVSRDCAILRGKLPVSDISVSNASLAMNWPGAGISQSFALLRGVVKSAEDFINNGGTQQFLGNFNPRSNVCSAHHGNSSAGVLTWDWEFEFGPANPGFHTPGDSDSRFGYWGPSNSAAGLSDFSPTRTILYDLPKEPLVSLGQFQNAQLSMYPHEPNYTFGNSFAPLNGLSKTNWLGDADGYRLIDTSYALNDAMWDDYFFSTISPSLESSELNEPLPNSHLVITSELEESELLQVIKEYDEVAAHLLVNGGFNVNSTSERAWAAVLGSMAGLTVATQNNEDPSVYENVFLRNASPYNGDGDEWSGFSEIPSSSIYNSDLQQPSLVKSLVDEIKGRIRSQGRPFFSLSEFVNRRLSDDAYGEKGALQAAIDDSEINGTLTPFSPGAVTQSDVLSAIGSKLTARSDTFVIRAYGETSSDLTGARIAQAMCEVEVQRQPEYVVEGEDGNLPTDGFADLSVLNKQLGRAFKITSFRWIN